MKEMVILGTQHENNMGERIVEYYRPCTVRIQVLLDDYQNTYATRSDTWQPINWIRPGSPASKLVTCPKMHRSRSASTWQRSTGRRGNAALKADSHLSRKVDESLKDLRLTYFIHSKIHTRPCSSPMITQRSSGDNARLEIALSLQNKTRLSPVRAFHTLTV